MENNSSKISSDDSIVQGDAGFLRTKHIEFIQSLNSNPDSLEYKLSAHLLMSAIYWSLTALDLMSALDALPREEILKFVKSCFNSCDGGYGASPKFDSHLLYTLSAVQIAAILDALDIIPVDQVAEFVSSRQQPDGSFEGDKWGEIDARFTYCAVATLKIIERLEFINTTAAANYILGCCNHDYAYGASPEAESHGALTFCCLGALNILDKVPKDKSDLLGLWLSQRQLPNGGLNGRPQKLGDVCYSWWVLSSLCIIERNSWIDGAKLGKFILAAQSNDTGGISDREGGAPDVFHTLFGICGLSIIGGYELKRVDPTYCLPVDVVNRLKLHE